MDQHDQAQHNQDHHESEAATRPRRQRTHRGRKRLRRIHCPVHSEERLISCSVKRHLVRNAAGGLFAAPPGRPQADEWAAGFGVQVLADQWLETLFCPLCATHRTWHVVDRGDGDCQAMELPASVRQQLGTAAVLIPVTHNQKGFRPKEG